MKVKRKAPAASKTKTKSDDTDYEDEDDEEYEDERPRKKKSSKPSSNKASTKYDEDEDDDDEDDDDEDEGLRGGWGAYEENKANTSDFPNECKLGDDPILVRFLDPEPLVAFNQHWIERQGKKSFVCLNRRKTDGKCPLCDIGTKPSPKNAFNVVAFVKGDPVNQILFAGIKLTDQISRKLKTRQERTPKFKLTSGYFTLARTGKGGRSNFDVQIVKERDLEEDWEVEALDEKQMTELKKGKWSGADAVKRQTRKELTEIAKEISGDFDADDEDDD